MRLIGLAVVLAVSFTLAPLAAEAQQAGKIYRLGILTTSEASTFEQELRGLGYVEGGNILITRRYTHGNLEAARRLATEIVNSRPDVVLVSNGEMAGAIARASSTVPIVVAAASDLVAQGHARNLAQPGGRVTGLQIMSGDLSGKRVEILREMVPRLARLAVLVPAAYSRGFYSERQQTEKAASTLGVQSDFMWVQERNDLAPTFKRVTRSSYDGLLVYANPFMYSERGEIAQLAKASGVPAMYETREFVIAGGLVSYGPNVSVLYRRAATFVDKILKGAKPADLPVEQPTKFELVINLKTAKALGLTIPQTLLLRADEIIR
jgi:ABC-type uncharacterized transport system substrate-binding protein